MSERLTLTGIAVKLERERAHARKCEAEMHTKDANAMRWYRGFADAWELATGTLCDYIAQELAEGPYPLDREHSELQALREAVRRAERQIEDVQEEELRFDAVAVLRWHTDAHMGESS